MPGSVTQYRACWRGMGALSAERWGMPGCRARHASTTCAVVLGALSAKGWGMPGSVTPALLCWVRRRLARDAEADQGRLSESPAGRRQELPKSRNRSKTESSLNSLLLAAGKSSL